MTVVRALGQYSGRTYGWRIAGETPTVDEQMAFDAFVRRREREFAAQYQERWGRNIEPQGTFVGEAVRGLGSGAAGLLESGALGLASLLPQGWEDPAREAIRGAGYRVQRALAPYANYEGSLTRTLSEGLGSTAPFFALAPLGGLGAAAGAALGAAAGAGEASERAYAAGATEEERSRAALLGAGVGLSEIGVPVALRGLFGSLLRAGVPETTIMARLWRIGTAATAEGAQEAAAEFLQNAIEQGVYNPEQDLAEGLLPAAGVGGGVGAIIQGLVELGTRSRGLRGRRGEVAPTAASPTPPAPAPAAEPAALLALPPPAAEPAPAASTPTPTPAAEPAPAASTPTPTPAAAAPSARAPNKDFDTAATLAALRNASGNYATAMRELGISYPEMQQRIRHLESLGAVAFDRASGTMRFPDVAPTATPAAPAATVLTAELTRILDELQIPSRAAVRNKVRSGAVETLDGLVNELKKYGANPKVPLETRGRVQSWLNMPTEAQFSQPGAPDGQAPQAPQSPVSGPVGLDALTDRIGAQGSIGEPGIGAEPGGNQPAGAAAPVAPAVAEPVPGAPAPDDAATEQPAALNPEVPAQPLVGAAPRAAPPTPSPSPAASEGVAATPAAPARQLIPGARVRVDPQTLQATSRPFFRPGDVEDYSAPPPGARPAPETDTEGDIPSRFAQGRNKPRPPTPEEAAVAREQVAQWFDANAPADVQEANRRLKPSDLESANIRVADAAAIVKLLQGKEPTATDDKNNTPEAAAYRYFSRYRDPGLSLNAIASDAAEAAAHARHMADRKEAGFKSAMPGLFNPPTWTLASLRKDYGKGFELSPTDRLLVGLGRNPGASAMGWVEANLSPDTVTELRSLMNRRATNREAGYQFVNVLGSIEVRNQRQTAVREEQAKLENAARKSRGLSPEKWAELSPEVRKELIRDYRSLEKEREKDAARSLARARQLKGQFSYAWPTSAHPQVGSLIRAGNFPAALSTLANTARNGYQRRLAAALLPRLQNTRAQAVPSAELARVQSAMSPETPTLGKRPAAVYVWPMSAAGVRQLRDNGHTEAADLIDRYGGQILFDAAVPMSPELVLHEAVHAAADSVLNNPSHPLTRRLENLRQALLGKMPADTYGLNNVHELLAEGMSNPAFRRDLNYLNTSGEARSAWERFRSIMRDFLRSLIGLPPSGPNDPSSARDLIDSTMNDILALGPSDVEAGSILGASFQTMQGARDALGRVKDNVRVPTAADMQGMREMLQNVSVPGSWKQAFTHLFMPIRYVADAAAKYMPSAPALADAVNQHKAEIVKYEQIVSSAVEKVTDILRKYRNNRDVLDNFNRAVNQGTLIATQFGVDFRKPRSTYEGKPDRFDADALAAYDRVRQAYDSLKPDVQEAVRRVFAMPVALRPELQNALRERIEALAPGNKRLQEKIFKSIYDKIFAADLVDPFAPLRRTGQYWLSYNGTDPETGQPDVFIHAFQTRGEQEEAIRRLMALESGIDKASIKPFMNAAGMRNKPEVPMEYVANVLDAIDGSAELAQMVDPETGEAGGLRQRVIELMFDNLPETSFVNSFRKRKGVRGFIGDMTPFTQGLTYGDTVKNVTEANQRLGRQIADMRFGARFSALRNALQREYKDFTSAEPSKDPALSREFAAIAANPTLAPEQKIVAVEEARRRYLQRRPREVEEAKNLHDTLRSYSFVPFRQRAGWASAAVSGTYMLTLGFNASTALITLSQIPLFIAPFLSGKHGMRRTIAAIGLAHRLLAGSGKMRDRQTINERGEIVTERVAAPLFSFSMDNYTDTDPQSAYMEPMLRLARRNGVFNHSLIQDQLLGEQPTLWQRLAGWSGIMQHHAERYSREVALTASYHLELQSQMGSDLPLDKFISGLRDGTIKPTGEQMEAAALEAVEVSERTNGPILAAAGPLASQNDIGSVAYLFKRHPISMLNLMFQTAKRSNLFNLSPDQRTEDQNIARRQFAGMVGMMALMSGALGLPLMQQVGWLYDLLIADDDEPDFDTVVRMHLGEAGAFGLLDFLTGQRASERISLSSAIYRPGFAAEQLPPQYQFIEAVGGPVVGMINKYINRFPDLLSQGEYWRAAEAAMPSAFANMMRAYRFSQDGVLTMRGDPILGDIGPFDIAAQSLGFMSAAYSQQLAINSQRSRIDNAIGTRRTRLLQQLHIATRNNDWASVDEIYARIAEFNVRNPNFPITRETIRDSLRQHQRTTQQMEAGVNINPRNRERINEMIQLGSPSVWGV